MRNILLWDLDGTLTDPVQGITNAVQYALRSFGIHEPDRQKLRLFIGPPLKDSFREFYGFSDEEAERVITVYREYFADTGIFENELYPGIAPLLKLLNNKGKIQVLATSKPTVFARRILDHFGIASYFTQIIGSNLDGSRVKKAEVIAYALELLGMPDPKNVLMIGDRCYDILGAREMGLDALGVTYGYGTRQELETAGALAIADSVEDLAELITQI